MSSKPHSNTHSVIKAPVRAAYPNFLYPSFLYQGSLAALALAVFTVTASAAVAQNKQPAAPPAANTQHTDTQGPNRAQAYYPLHARA